MTQRVCFQFRIKPSRMDEYVERHAAAWPEFLEALRDCGWRNYSLFLREDGELTGYFETDDLAASEAAMAERGINSRWQADMLPFFDVPDGAEPSSIRLREVFNLDDQLTASAAHH